MTGVFAGLTLLQLSLLLARRSDPRDIHLLEIGIGGITGTLTNIRTSAYYHDIFRHHTSDHPNENTLILVSHYVFVHKQHQTDGAASMAWHGSQQVLARDKTSCDFGVGFYGHAVNSGSFLVNGHCYLCDVIRVSGDAFVVVPRDSFHRRLYVASLSLDVILETGEIVNATVASAFTDMVLHVRAIAAAKSVRVRLSCPASSAALVAECKRWQVEGHISLVRGAAEVPIATNSMAMVTLSRISTPLPQKHRPSA